MSERNRGQRLGSLMDIVKLSLAIPARTKQNPPRHCLHFLHIGKTGGTKLAELLARLFPGGEGSDYLVHRHTMPMRKIPGSQDYFFSVRDPRTRYVSAFYDRKRFGRDGNAPWSTEEAEFFKYFSHATDAAEVLLDASKSGEIARGGFHSVQHIRDHQHSWFYPLGYFLKSRPPVMVIRQEHLNSDFRLLAQVLGVEVKSDLDLDRRANKTEYEEIPRLSPKAEQNLLRWYAADAEFYRDVSKFIKSVSLNHSRNQD